MSRTLLAQRATAFLFLSIASACGGDKVGTTGPLIITPGLRIVAGGGATDTVDAVITQALTVQVADASGNATPGLLVRFTSLSAPDPNTPTFPQWSMLLSPLASATWTKFGVDTTNASGKATILVRMGRVAGTGRIAVHVPSLAIVDTARFTVMAGATVRMAVSPRDTGLYIGGSAAIRVPAFDRYGNPKPVTPVFTTSSNRISMNGAVATGVTVGRSMVSVVAGTLRDSMFVTVVPRGTVAAYRYAGGTLALYAVDLDGSNYRLLAPTVVFDGYNGEMPPVWSQDGQSVFYHDNKTDHTKMLWVVDATTLARRRLVGTGQQLADERFPTRSADGRWLYFNGPDYGVSQAYRARTDGSAVELVSPTGMTQSYPHPSPDGTRMVYASAGRLEVMTLATKAITRLGVAANIARWSPSGNFITYKDDNPGFYIVRPDGTGLRQIATGTGSLLFFDWSSDEKYIVASVNGRITLVDVATGELLPIALPATQSFAAPSWKP